MLIKVRDYLTRFSINIVYSIHSKDVRKLSKQSEGDYGLATLRKYVYQYTQNIHIHIGYNYTTHLGEDKLISEVK